MRVLALIHSLCGHGHAAVLSGVLRALGDRDRELCALVVAGGAPLPAAMFPAGVDVMQLPALLPSRGLFSELQPRLSHMTRMELRKLRVKVQSALLESFRPDVIVVEHFPVGRFGLRKELCAVLENARARLPGVVCVSSVAVLGGQASGHEDDSVEHARRYFDRLLVHTDPRVETLGDDIPDAQSRLGERLVHTGYVLRRPPCPTPRESLRERLGVDRSATLVVVHAGGGRDGGPMLRRALQALDRVNRERPVHVRAIAGAALPRQEYEALRELVRDMPHVTLSQEDPALPEWVAAAELCVCMAGYASAAEVVAAGTRALLLPRDTEEEQLRRARRLHSLGLAVHAPSAADAGALAAQIQELLSSPPPPRSHLRFDGAEVAASEIIAAVARVRAVPRARTEVTPCA